MSAAAPARNLVPYILGVLALAAVLRGIAITDGLWIDEVWSLRHLEELSNWWDVFVGLKHDNNHQLITLWMYMLGDLDNWILYRLPSLLGGLATVFLVLDRERGAWGVILPGVVFAVSFLMLVYGTEARGYALSFCFSLAAFRLLERRESEGFRLTHAEAVGYWVCVVLAFSSHFTALHFFVAAILFTYVQLSRREPFGTVALRLARLHFVPGLWVLFLWWFVVREIEIGGGREDPARVIALQLMSWFSGAPASMVAAAAGTAVLLGLAGYECVARARVGSFVWVFVSAAAGVTPVFVLAVTDPKDILYPRYFLVGAGFALLFAARGMVRLRAQGGLLAVAGLVLAGLFVVGNVARDVRFLQGGGRGSYLEAVKFMSERSPQKFVVGTDMDFRTFGQLEYYRRFLRPGQEMFFLLESARATDAAHWILIHDSWYDECGYQRKPYHDPMELPGGLYKIVGEFGHWGPSGFSWVVFKRIG